MGKFHIAIATKFGEISVDGDTKEEVLSFLKEAISLIDEASLLIPKDKMVESISTPVVTVAAVKKGLEGIIETTAGGRPQITVNPNSFSAKDVIGLFLYWKYPDGLPLGELTEFVGISWKAVDEKSVGANVSMMKGLILKEGQRGKYIFKLSGTGKSWVESDLLPKIKAKNS